jgi:hypothetical protein
MQGEVADGNKGSQKGAQLRVQISTSSLNCSPVLGNAIPDLLATSSVTTSEGIEEVEGGDEKIAAVDTLLTWLVASAQEEDGMDEEKEGGSESPAKELDTENLGETSFAERVSVEGRIEPRILPYVDSGWTWDEWDELEDSKLEPSGGTNEVSFDGSGWKPFGLPTKALTPVTFIPDGNEDPDSAGAASSASSFKITPDDVVVSTHTAATVSVSPSGVQSSSGDLMTVETRARGQMDGRVLWAFIQAAGGFAWLSSLLFLLVLERAVYISADWWLAVWASAATTKPQVLSVSKTITTNAFAHQNTVLMSGVSGPA